MINNKNVIITGGAGFIGSHVTDVLIENGFNVFIADNYSTPDSGYRNPKAIYINSDILSENIEEVFKSSNSAFCVHLAANASVATSTKDPEYDAAQNIIGTIKIINLCKKYKIKKIIAASSAAVYGNPQYLPVDENHPQNTLSYYGLSKLTMEKYIQLSGLDYIIFRFANVYGERQNSSGEAGVVSVFKNHMGNNEQVYIDDDGEQTRDFIYVKDVALAVLNALETPVKNEIINVSTNSALSINELYKKLSELYAYDKCPVYREKRSGDIKHSVLNNKKYKEKFGIKSFTDFDSAMGITVNIGK